MLAYDIDRRCVSQTVRPLDKIRGYAIQVIERYTAFFPSILDPGTVGKLQFRTVLLLVKPTARTKTVYTAYRGHEKEKGQLYNVSEIQFPTDGCANKGEACLSRERAARGTLRRLRVRKSRYSLRAVLERLPARTREREHTYTEYCIQK